jgi:hypothetical protein
MYIHTRRTVSLAFLIGCVTLPTAAIGQTTDSTVELVLQAGRPLQVALDKRVTVHRIGQLITGTLVQSVYVYDRIVLPAGSRFSGHIDRLEPASRKHRLIAMAGGDFSPHRRIVVTFDTITIGEGDPIAIESIVTGGGGRVKREVAAGASSEEPEQGKTSAAGLVRQKVTEE